MSLGAQVAVLFILAIPIAAISWTITHEEVLREPREWCVRRSRLSRSWYLRKLFYVFTCEYCFSHWVTMAFLVATRFTMLYPGPLGYIVAGFSLVWVANLYMSFFARLRLEIKEERLEVEKIENELEK
jgi:hypothetical protein